MWTLNQSEGVWQPSQKVVVLMWVPDWPVAVTPSWQLTHEPMVSAWSTWAGAQAVVP